MFLLDVKKLFNHVNEWPVTYVTESLMYTFTYYY